MKDKKLCLMYLLEYLKEYSDEHNMVSTNDIIQYLNNRGLKIHRTTLEEYVILLIEFGIDVKKVKSSPNKYYIDSRDFELAELKLLVDAVYSSKLITHSKSIDLVNKLSNLTSNHMAEELFREVHVTGRIKPQNEYVYKTIDVIHYAIKNNRKIEFKYFDYSATKEKVLKHNGYVYSFSPYTLFWNNDNYYAIGYSDKHNKIVAFRVDRISSAEVTAFHGHEKPDDYCPEEYAKEVFSMFDGEDSLVTLRCHNSLMNVIVDRFGEDVCTEVSCDDEFDAFVKVSVSPTFFAFVVQFEGMIKITEPIEVTNKYIQMLKKIIENND